MSMSISTLVLAAIWILLGRERAPWRGHRPDPHAEAFAPATLALIFISRGRRVCARSVVRFKRRRGQCGGAPKRFKDCGPTEHRWPTFVAALRISNEAEIRHQTNRLCHLQRFAGRQRAAATCGAGAFEEVDDRHHSLVGVADRVTAASAPEGLPAGKRTRYRLMELAYAGVEGDTVHKQSQRPYPKASVRKS